MKKQQSSVILLMILFTLVFIIILLRGVPDTNPVDDFIHDHNIEALQDSIRTYKTKNGELVYEKMALVTKHKDLSKYNKELANKVKYLEDRLLAATDFDVIVVHDTIWIVPQIDNNNTHFNEDSTVKVTKFNWAHSDTFSTNNYRSLGGSYLVQVDKELNTITDSFTISNDIISMSFTTGLTENKNDQVEIFIKSDYPGFEPTAINGALFDPRESKVIKKFFPPKKWGLSIHGGYGLYYDPVNSHAGHGIQIGVGVSYDILQWRRKK